MSNVTDRFSEEKLFLKKTEDMLRLSEKRNKAQCSVFLTEAQVQLSLPMLKSARETEYSFSGGYDGAERVVLRVAPKDGGTSYFSDEEEYGIETLTISWKSMDSLTHRDFLGTLMSLGIKRECVGDILTENKRCVIFVKKEIASYLKAELRKVAGCSVSVSEGADTPLPAAGKFEEISGTLASDRLDCVVKALISSGRENAAELIKAGLVTLRFKEQTSVSASVCEGDKISIRGHGKFIVDKIGPQSKKGRLFFAARKYI
ncbi:MAG: hypothetical protein LBL82_02705 [Oscillospiraceae bacterium]|jgi:RNA-binding protein YlmH|nr:hypothetical protein [Oscillospiraceae bacterium]